MTAAVDKTATGQQPEKTVSDASEADVAFFLGRLSAVLLMAGYVFHSANPGSGVLTVADPKFPDTFMRLEVT